VGGVGHGSTVGNGSVSIGAIGSVGGDDGGTVAESAVGQGKSSSNDSGIRLGGGEGYGHEGEESKYLQKKQGLVNT